MRKRYSMVFTLALAAGCNNTSSTGDAAAGPDMALAAEDFAQTGMPTATTAVVTTSSLNFMGGQGSLNTVKLADKTVTKAIDTTLDVDNVVRAAAGRVYVLDRTHGALRIYDPSMQFMMPTEIATGDATAVHDTSDPSDAYPIPASSKIYVAMYGNDAMHAIGVVDSTQPAKGVVKWIAIPAAGSVLPRAAGFWFCGPYLYVMLEDLDAKFGVTGPGRIAVLDVGADQVAANGIIQLMGTDPGVGLAGAITALSPGACDQVLVAHAGDFNQMDLAKKNGGIEQVDLTGRKSSGLLFTGTDLGGTANTVSSASAHLAYVVVNNPDFTQKLVMVDPTAKKVLGDGSGAAGTIAFAAVTPDGSQLYFGVENGGTMGQLAPGLYIAPTDGTKVASQPIDLGQAPYGVSFY